MTNSLSRKEKLGAFLAGILTGAVVLGFAILQVPRVQNSLSWRVEFAKAFVRGIVNPVKPMPTVSTSSIDNNGQDFIIPMASKIDFTATSTWKPSPSPEAMITASVTPTPAPTFTPTPIPGEAQLAPPPYEKQDLNNCGPATLSMNLHYYGWEGDQYTISDLIKPKRADRNVNVEELVGYVHTEVHGLEIIYRVGGDIEMLKKLIAAGFPVTIEEAFIMNESYWPNDDRWAGHYLLLTGYNDAEQSFTAQDVFVGPRIKVSYTTLDHNWKAFNRVYIVVYPYDQSAALQSVLGDHWDAEFNRQHALETAKAETERDSTDSFAWFNLGTNLVYFEKYSQASGAYDQARNYGLPQRMLRYQFGPFFAYFHTGRIDDLLALTEYALDRTPNSEEAMLWRGWAFYRKGNIAETEKLFLAALEARPSYPDAVYGLNFIRNN